MYDDHAQVDEERLSSDERLIKNRTDELNRASEGDHRRRAVMDKVRHYLTERVKPSAQRLT